MKTIRFFNQIQDIEPSQWNELTQNNNPFLEHSFLLQLETSQSVGSSFSGWKPFYATIWNQEQLIGATPTYLKTDSYGEFIFDWMWANVYEQVQLPYYPKITTAIPFTSATGKRLLVHRLCSQTEKEEIQNLLVQALEELQNKQGCSGSHFLYCTEEEADFLVKKGYFKRLTHQYHWRNNGYVSFDAFLKALTSSSRKQIKKERKKIQAQDLEIILRKGHDITAEDWKNMYHLYLETSSKKWGSPYLTQGFFTQRSPQFAENALMCIAQFQGKTVASSLSFAQGKHLYGRYWGCFEEFECLHFELCYYRLVEYAIGEKMVLVEAGAQGEHKIKRGFLPVLTFSAHKLQISQLHKAIQEYTQQENKAWEKEILHEPISGPFQIQETPLWERKAGIVLE